MIDAIIRFSIERRFLMLSMVLFVVGAGVWGYQRLPIDAVPDITNVQVQINTEAPGYSPLEVEQRITFAVETALYGLPSLDYSRSMSRYGLSQVTVVFKDGTDIYFARDRINERLGAIRAALPPGIEPMMGPVATGLSEIFQYTIAALPGATQADGSPLDATALREIQEWIIKPQLAQVEGIAEINTFGGFNKQYHVTPDPRRLLQHGVTLHVLAEALRNNNANRGAGYIERNGQQLLVRSTGQLASIEDIQQVVVARHGSVPVLVRDVADVAIGKELRSGAATHDGEESVLGMAMMLVGENSRTVAHAAANKLEEIQSSLPAGVRVEAVYDRTTLVDKTIATVQTNLLEGALLVVLVLFLLLGNVRAALITAAVIPLAMMATIFGMVQTGVSASLMSLGALDFGLIVDGAVIIVENCVRRLSQARSDHNRDQHNAELSLRARLEVVYTATTEVIRPSLFGVAIITVVYIPIFTLTGVEGKMFHPMAATVVMALVAAMVFSLTLIPAAVAIFLRGNAGTGESRVIVAGKSLYRPLLEVAVRWRWLLVSAATLLVVCCAWLMTTLGSEFIPQLDEGDITMHAMRVNGTGLEQSVDMQKLLEKHVLQFPEVEKTFAKIGTPDVATDPMPPNLADSFIILKPRDEWPNPAKPKAQLLQELQVALQELPGNNYEFTQPIQMRFNELISGVRSNLGIKVFGDDIDQLLSSAEQIATVVRAIDGAADVSVEQVEGLPMLGIEPRRSLLARYGLTVDDLQDTLAMSIGGEEVGVIYEGDRRFSLVVRLPEALRRDIDKLHALPVSLPDGGYIPLAEIATVAIKPAPAQISRENGKRRVVVSANVRERDLGGFVDEVKARIADEVTLPSGYWLAYGGTFEQMESAGRRLFIVVPATLAIIMGLLVLAFGSIKDALIVFTGVPMALTGGVLALWLRGMPLSIPAAIGFIALSGVAVLNGLVLVTFIRDRWRDTADLMGAVLDGALSRLRPVLMTALVASLGFLPMALNTGTGAEVQRPLATVVIGGIISSTLLTLLVLPVIYHWVHRREHCK